jgi:translocation and assembly module TamB
MVDPRPTPPPPSNPRRKRWPYAVGSLVLLAVFAWFAPWLAAHTPLRHWIAQRIFPDVEGKFVVGRASLGWLSPVIVEDLVLRDGAGRPILTAPRVTSGRNLLSIVLTPSRPGHFHIDKPTLDIICSGSESNFEQVFARSLGPRELRPARVGFDVDLVEARIRIRDEDTRAQFTFEPVKLTYVSPPDRTEPIRLNVEGRMQDGARVCTLKTELAMSEFRDGDFYLTRGEIDADLAELPLRLFGPWLRRAAPGGKLDGHAACRLHYQWDKDESRLDGRLNVRKLFLAGPWLGRDQVRFDTLDIPCKLAIAGDNLRLDQADMTCDLGKISARGSFDLNRPVLAGLSHPGNDLDADVNLARLANMLPHTLHLHKDTNVASGRLTMRVRCLPRPDGVAWEGQLSTSDLKGTARGQPVVWPAPLQARFQAHQTGESLPIVDVLHCDSGFLQMEAREEPGQWLIGIGYDLNRLAQELSHFVDLGPARIAGKGWSRIVLRKPDPKSFQAAGESHWTDFELTGIGGSHWKENAIDLDLFALGSIAPGGKHAVDTGNVRVRAGGTTLDIKLLEPLADLRSGLAGHFHVHAQGDLGPWQNRLRSFVPGLESWRWTGTGDMTADINSAGDGLAIDNGIGLIRELSCSGPGLGIHEPTVGLKFRGRWQPGKGALELGDTQITCSTFALEIPNLQASLPQKIIGLAKLQIELDRLDRWFARPGPNDASWKGILTGQVQFNSRPAGFDYKADMAIRDLAHGAPGAPSWREPLVKLAGAGFLDAAADALELADLHGECSLGVMNAKGKISRLSADQELALAGTLDYDMTKLKPLLESFLGRGVKIQGRGARSFQLNGPLASAAARAPGLWGRLHGEGGVAWSDLEAFGVQLGPAEVQGRLAKGWLRLGPVTCKVNDGRFHLESSLRLDPEPAEMHVARGTIVDHARMTAAMCAGAIGYAAPALARVTRADGLISVAIDDCRLPLDAPERGFVKGRLFIHDAGLGGGPLVRELGVLLHRPTEARLAKESVIPFKLEDGKVYHEKMELIFPELTVRTHGWVALDGRLALTAEFPIPPRWAGKTPLTAALAKQTIRIPIAGTLEQPRLDAVALQAASIQFARDLAKELLRQQLQKRLKKILDR